METNASNVSNVSNVSNILDSINNKNSKRKRDLEIELVKNEIDQINETNPKREISYLDCLRDMDQKNNELIQKPVTFILWRFSKETKNYKISIKKLYFIKKTNKGKMRRHRPFKFCPSIETTVLKLDKNSSKPYWTSVKDFSTINLAFEFILKECNMQSKKINAFEELSRLIIPSKQWQSLKQWLPSYYIEKYEIVDFIDESDDDDHISQLNRSSDDLDQKKQKHESIQENNSKSNVPYESKREIESDDSNDQESINHYYVPSSPPKLAHIYT